MDINSSNSAPVADPVSTNFSEDGAVIAHDYTSTPSPDPIAVTDQRLADFLAKPILYTEISWSTGTNKAAILAGDTCKNIITASPAWTDKMSGYGLMRGTFVFRLQVNANPFMQGKLLLSFLPNYADVAALTPCFYSMHMGVPGGNANLPTARQLPCVELDCRESCAILKIPYIAPYSWFNVKTQHYDWGSFYISVLSKLQTNGSESSCSISMYVHIEDAEFAAPTKPQMAGGGSKRFKTKSYGKAPTEVEESKMESGSISTALRSVSGVADVLGDIPVLGEFARPAAWAAAIAGNAAAALGWSKPILESAPMHMSMQWNRYMATADGLDTSVPLAVTSTHAITPSDGAAIMKEDQMSMAFLNQVSTVCSPVISNVTTPLYWSDATASGTSIYSQAIGPANLYEVADRYQGSHTAEYRMGPPIWYLSNFFKLWRGSICLVIKFAKTEFHSGRLQITWTPGDSSTVSTLPTTTTSEYSLREIIDIREGNEVCLVLPWLLPYNYAYTYAPSGIDAGTMGNLDIMVVNKLVHPDNVASNVELLFYWAGGPDFEFAFPGPVGAGYSPTPFSPQMLCEPQMNKASSEDLIVSNAIGSCKPSNTASTLFSEQSIGERVLSIRQLLLRFSMWYQNSIVSGLTGLYVWPWHTGPVYIASGTGVLSSANSGGDIFNAMAPMYLYYRGNMRVGYCGDLTGPSAVETGVDYVMPATVNTSWASTGTSAPIAINSTVVFAQGSVSWQLNSLSYTAIPTCGLGVSYTPGSAFCSWVVPYYSRCLASIVAPMQADFIPADDSIPLGTLQIGSTSVSAGTYNLVRATTDDFQFSYFLGCPPLLSGYS
jgi:hypothetical protein